MPPHQRKFLIFIPALFFFLSAGMLKATPPAGYVLVWSDEFNGALGSPPNSANWGYDLGDGGWGNNELENYTNNTANAQIVTDPTDTSPTDGSYLAIIAIDTTPGNPTYSTVGRYTSARLDGLGKQSSQYGWIESRIKVPTGQGIWPAFWMLGTDYDSVGWPACGEMDIMEQVGNACCLANNYGSLHCPGYNTSNNIYTLSSGDFYTSYHTFAIEWQQNAVQFYVDNILYENPSTQTNTQVAGAGGTWEFNQPFFFLLNVAVGGSFPGTPDASTSFPQTMFVDYVRVYEPATPTPTPTFTPTLTPTPCPSCPPTPTPTSIISIPIVYPNPSKGGPVQVHMPGRTVVSNVVVKIFTTSFRKVSDETFSQVPPGNDVTIPVTDAAQSPLANGLYYVVASTSEGSCVIKLLVLR